MPYVEEESATRTMSDNSNIDATVARAAIMSETIVFCTLVVLGGGLFALFATTQLDWYYPTVFYGVVVYIAWQRYFGISARVIRATQMTVDQEVARHDTKGLQQATDRELEAIKESARQGLQVAKEATEQMDKIRRQSARTDEVLRQTERATREAELRAAVLGALKTANYDDFSVEEISQRLDGLSAEQLRKVREYEKQNKNRETLIEQIDRKIRADNS